jgi:hypothetical protein
MKYFLVFLFLFLLSCSLDKDSIKKNIEKKKYTKILEKNEDFKQMSFDEFDLFLKEYSKNSDYPDINK